jgi:hypothetical protein
MTPEIALINAVRTKLKGDASVTALATKGIFDQVPSGTTAPYVYIGPVSRTRLQIDCYQVWSIRIRIYCISTGFNRSQDWEIAEAIIQSLDLQEFALDEPFVQSEPIKITQAGDVVDPNAPKSVFVDITSTIARAP